MNNQLYVFINNIFEGTLSVDASGDLAFQYDKSAKIPLSLSLPLRQEPYTDKECHGYFNGLLPESDNARLYIAEKYHIKNPNNDFEILKAIGYDCPGAISFSKTQNPEELSEYYNISGEEITEERLEKIIKELPYRPLGTGKNLRLSLAGVQEKTAVLIHNNKILLPTNDTPTTHIIKPAIKTLKETVENEYICLKIAEKLGIKVPNTAIHTAGKTKYFIIERFDRIIKDNKIKRLHQEDFCQALNIPSAFKYEIYGGVSLKNCFEILNKTSVPAKSINEFLNLMIFNYLIINNDAHGKNFSIIYKDNKIELAPAYDLMCTKVYKNLDYKMAMEIGGYYDCEGIKPIHFKKMANEAGISYALLKKLIIDYCNSLPAAAEEVINSFENTIGKQILAVIKKQCQRNMKEFKK